MKSKFVRAGLTAAGVVLCVLLAFFLWEIWNRGLAYAFREENVYWYLGKLGLLVAFAVIVAFSGWAEEWLSRRRAKTARKNQIDNDKS